MTSVFGTGIFWITIVAVIAIMSLATFIGRLLGTLFPWRLRASARFYLAPVLGLAVLTLLASLLVRFVPLGNSIIVPCLVVGLLMVSICCERCKKQAVRHALLVSFFGIVCGASLLGALYVYGAFNAHNDAFTYLVHARWLQEHAFGDLIVPENVTRFNSQIYLYQKGGFRMGASFLLALVQSLLNLHWSYEVYPSVLISAIAAFCLAIGFPLAQILRPIHRGVRFLLLAGPSFTLGGVVFGAVYGFLPQTVGLAFCAGALFAFGSLLRWLSNAVVSWKTVVKMMFPVAVLFSVAVFAYSEIMPFLFVAIASSAFFVAIRFHVFKKVLHCSAALFVFALLLLNLELVRTYTALRIQSGAVNGSGVDWSLLGYVAHAFGVHGGAWDFFQWTSPANFVIVPWSIGVALISLIGLLVLSAGRSIRNSFLSGTLMPSGIILIFFLFGFVYFRYFVSSPFPQGFGQSWNQFKLTDWAYPFLMVFVVLSIAILRPRLGKLFNGIVIFLFIVGVGGTTLLSIARIKPHIQYYGNTQNLDRFYREFRRTVLSTCSPGHRVYLNTSNITFKRMAVCYLPESEIIADWAGDCYISPYLPVRYRSQSLQVGDCVVELADQNELLKEGVTVGPFRVGVFDGHGTVRVASVDGACGRESNGSNWWHWVEHKVTFHLRPLFVPKQTTKTKVRFGYETRGAQLLTVRIIKLDQTIEEIELQSRGGIIESFEAVLDLSPFEIAAISIESNGTATPLSNKDSRMAAWCVSNLAVVPVVSWEARIHRVDFSKSAWPDVISKVSGLSEAEPWGTWSTGAVVTIDFTMPLPEKFTVHLVASALGPNIGKEFVAHVGDETFKFKLADLPEERVLEFNNPKKSKTIRIDIPSPVSPKELGMNNDARKLGIGFTELRIVPK